MVSKRNYTILVKDKKSGKWKFSSISYTKSGAEDMANMIRYANLNKVKKVGGRKVPKYVKVVKK